MTGAPEYGDLSYTLAGVRRQNPYDRRRRFAQQMMQSGMDFSPVQHPLQGVARLAQAIVGGWMGGQADRDEEAAAKKQQDAFATAMSETDPQKRISMIAAVDPALGARLSGQDAIEQMKRRREMEGLGQVAANYGYGPPSGGPLQGGQLAVPQGAAPGNPGGFTNNVGNIRATNINWEGKGAPHNGFETFATPQAGANAMAQNLRAYVQKNPGMTVAQAIARWAPPNENNTQAYIRGLSESTGVNPGMPLAEVLNDPVMAAQLMDGIARIEKGGMPQGFTADTFINAAGGNAQRPPLTINMTPGGPSNAPQPQIPQGDNAGMPPAPSPQAVSGPVLQAPPQLPQRMTVQDMPQEIKAPFVQRLLRGGYGTGPEAETRMVQDMQRALDVSFENQKLEYERNSRDYDYGRKRADEAPQKQFDNSNKLRDEFNGSKVVQNYREVTPIMESMKEAQQRPSRAADLNMVYALAKIMDPGSVVREGEMIMVNNTQGIGDRLAGMINSLNGGAMLTPEARQRIIEEAQSRYRGLEASYKALEDHYGGMSDRFGLRREDVIIPIRPKSAGDGNKPNPGAAALSEARDAIAKGAPRAKVIERLQQLGIDPAGL